MALATDRPEQSASGSQHVRSRGSPRLHPFVGANSHSRRCASPQRYEMLRQRIQTRTPNRLDLLALSSRKNENSLYLMVSEAQVGRPAVLLPLASLECPNLPHIARMSWTSPNIRQPEPCAP